MAPKRGSASRKRRDALRFVLIAPKRTRPLEFSDRLLHGGTAGRAHGLALTGPSHDRPGPNLSFLRRVAAAGIAAVGIFAGLAAATFGAREGEWVSGAAGTVLLLYGAGWFLAAVRGRLPGGRLGLNPWRRE
ncbi:MAG: hypothetical protein ACM3L8_09385 [Verrucomicrobiota bacterium]